MSGMATPSKRFHPNSDLSEVIQRVTVGPMSTSGTQKQSAKSQIITFKADPSLSEAMRGVPNRSEFIRAAVLAALENACPLCRGTGVLTPAQKRHWDAFAKKHAVRECDDCHAMRLVCDAKPARDRQPRRRAS